MMKVWIRRMSKTTGRGVVLGAYLLLGYLSAPWLFLPWVWVFPPIRDSLMLPFHIAGSRWIAVFGTMFVWIFIERGQKGGLWQFSFWQWFIFLGMGSFLTIQIGYILSIATDLQLWVVGEYPFEVDWQHDARDLINMPLAVLLGWIVHISHLGGLNFVIERSSVSEFRLLLPIFVWLLGVGWGCHRVCSVIATRLFPSATNGSGNNMIRLLFGRRLGIDLANYQWFIFYLNTTQFLLWPPVRFDIYVIQLLWGVFSVLCCTILSFAYLNVAARLLNR